MSVYKISLEASQDLNEIFDYFATVSVEAGERFVRDFEKKCQNLQRFPFMGRSYAELEPSLRGLPIDGHIILYRPVEQGIEIVRVVSGYQDLDSIFSEGSG